MFSNQQNISPYPNMNPIFTKLEQFSETNQDKQKRFRNIKKNYILPQLLVILKKLKAKEKKSFSLYKILKLHGCL